MKYMEVKAFSELCGVSVRTLHHYHSLGLLPPDQVDPATGYRRYGSPALARMQQILFWRELGFSLSEIKQLLNTGSSKEALASQERLLTLKKLRLERMIAALQKLQKGETIDMSIFDDTDIKNARALYANEARERWGATEEYAESERRSVVRGEDGEREMLAEMEAIFRDFAALAAAGEAPDSEKAAAEVRLWQAHISRYHYPCSDSILKSLGEMYSADERFRQKLDSYGPGTAEFMAAAIKAL